MLRFNDLIIFIILMIFFLNFSIRSTLLFFFRLDLCWIFLGYCNDLVYRSFKDIDLHSYYELFINIINIF